jgi:hypothetical protein
LLGVHLSPEHRSSTHETTRFIYSSIIPIRIFLIAFPRHHSCPYCPLVEKGWCVHATQTSQERQTQKEKTATRQVSACPHPEPRTKRPSAAGQRNTRACGEVGSNKHAPPGHTGRVGSPSPPSKPRPKRSLALSNPRSTATGPFLTTLQLFSL